VIKAIEKAAQGDQREYSEKMGCVPIYQLRYDMEVTRDQLQDKIKKEVRPFSHAA